jgi:Protein of unknown function (DUF732)
MAADRLNWRVAGLAAVSGPLLATGVIWAGPARADAASYLNDLHNVGIHDVQGGDPALLQVGQKLCDEVWYGEPPDQLQALALQRSDETLGKGGLTPQQATDLVNVAVADLCPNW